MLKCQARASYRRHHVKTCHLNRIVYTPANRSQLQRLQQVALPWYPACISAEVFAGMTAVVELCSARSPSGSARRISNAAVLVASLEGHAFLLLLRLHVRTCCNAERAGPAQCVQEGFARKELSEHIAPTLCRHPSPDHLKACRSPAHGSQPKLVTMPSLRRAQVSISVVQIYPLWCKVNGCMAGTPSSYAEFKCVRCEPKRSSCTRNGDLAWQSASQSATAPNAVSCSRNVLLHKYTPNTSG